MKIDMNIVMLILLSLCLALIIWGNARTSKAEDRCYEGCFPSVGKIIDSSCYCAIDSESWKLLELDVER